MGNWVTLQLTQVNQPYLNKMYFYVYARQQLCIGLAVCSSEQLGEVRRARLRASRSLLGPDAVSHLAGSVLQARVRCSLFQRLRLELGCAPGVLRAWEISVPAAPKANMASSELTRWNRALGRNPSPGEKGPPRARAEAGLWVRRCPASGLPLMDAALVRHRWPARLPARSVPFLLISAPLPTRFRSPLPHLAPVALLSTFLSPHLASVPCPPRNVCGPGLCSLPLLSRFQWLAGDVAQYVLSQARNPQAISDFSPTSTSFHDRFHPRSPLGASHRRALIQYWTPPASWNRLPFFYFPKKNPQSEHATSWMIAVRFVAELSVRTLASPAWTSAPSPAAVCPSALHARHTNFLLCLEEAFLLLHIPFFFSPKCPSHFL